MNEFKAAREAAGLTQQRMSELMGIPLLTISSWEIGRRQPPPYVTRLIFEKLAEIDKKNKKSK